MGITLSNLTTTGGMSEKRTHRPADGSAVGEYLVAGLLRNASEREIPLFVNAVVNKVNEKDGKVTGVNVTIERKRKNNCFKRCCFNNWWFRCQHGNGN